MRGVILAALLLTVVGCDESEVSGVLVTARTQDGSTLRASYQRPDAETPQQTLMLVHQPGDGHSKHDFDRIWDSLVDVGYGLLAIDLRSHGSSDDLGEPDVVTNDAFAFTRDIEIWLQYLAERENEGEAVSVNRTGIIGLGASGSLAAAAVAADRVRCAIAYSASIEQINRYYRGWAGDPDEEPGNALRDDIELSTTFWLTADQDLPPADDAPVLQEATSGDTALLVKEGIHHGAELLDFDEETLSVAVDWCADRL